MMKKNRLRPSSIQNRTRRCLPPLSLESLEERQVLAANVLVSIPDSITTASPRDEVMVTVSAEDDVTLIFEMSETGTGLNPAAPVVRATNGSPITPISSIADADGRTGRTVATLSPGEYLVETFAQSGVGSYRFSVSAVGDVDDSSGSVSTMESLRATAAMLQALGDTNHVTDLFFLQNGIDMSVDQYDSGFDINMNGSVEASEVGVIEANTGSGFVTVMAIADDIGPVISDLTLVNDTGSAVGVTTDPTISGTVTDDNTVSSVLVSLDGGAAVDVTEQLGDISSGEFTLTPALLDSVAGGNLAEGSHTVVVTASDEFGNVSDDDATLTFVFIETNDAPIVQGTSSTAVNEDAPLNFNINNVFDDPDAGDVLSFEAVGQLPSWLTISGNFLVGTPTNDDVGTETIMLTATDSEGLSVTGPLSIRVNPVNDAPVIAAIDDRTAEEDELFSIDLSEFITDVDDDLGSLMVTALQATSDGGPTSPLPSWLSLDPGTLVLSGTPTLDDLGNLGVLITVTDAASAFDSEFFTITVQDLNDPPELIQPIADASVTEGDTFSVDLNTVFEDTDLDDSLTFSAEQSDGSPLPSWLSINSSGVLTGEADDPDVGPTFEIVVTATDTFNSSVSDMFTLETTNVNDAPTASVPDLISTGSTTTAGTVIGTVTGADEDVGDTLTFTASGDDAVNFDVDSSTGDISVASGANLVDGQMFAFTVTVTDSEGATGTTTVNIRIVDNLPPTAVNDTAVATDAATTTFAGISLTSNDSDPDNDALTVSAVDATSANGASITIQNGNVVYDPRTSTTLLALREGDSMTDTFEYTVSDGNGGMDIGTVTVTVNGTDTLEFFLRTFDSDGNPISTIEPGGDFELRVFTQDRRGLDDSLAGVFAAFLDITYPQALAEVTGQLEHSDLYSTITNGTVTTPGLIDEAGGVDGITPIGNDEFEVFRVTMRASSTPGVINFASDPADETIQNAVLVYLEDDRVPDEQIIFGSTSLTIAGPIPPLSGSVPGTNFANPMDTNDDGSVSPSDVLLVINSMQSGSTRMYPDVNGDGVVSAIDALNIINYLARGPQAPLSASESAVETSFGAADELPESEAIQGVSLAAEVSVDSVLSTRGDSGAVLAEYDIDEDEGVRVQASTNHKSIVDAIFADLA